MTERFYYRAEVGANWKLFIDAFQEFYHAPVLHAKQSPVDVLEGCQREAGFEAPHYEIDGPHRHGQHVRRPGLARWPPRWSSRSRRLPRSGLFGPWDAPDLGVDDARRRSTPAKCEPWGLDSFQSVPELRDPGLGPGLVPHVPLLADVVQHARLRGHALLRRAEERRASGRAGDGRGAFKEYGLQDGNTLEATQIDARVARGRPRSRSTTRRSSAATCTRWPPHGSTTTSARRRRCDAMTDACCPTEFADLEPFARRGACRPKPERYAKRLASSMDEMQAFYDAFTPRAEEAIAYCDKFPLDDMPEDVLNLCTCCTRSSWCRSRWRLAPAARARLRRRVPRPADRTRAVTDTVPSCGPTAGSTSTRARCARRPCVVVEGDRIAAVESRRAAEHPADRDRPRRRHAAARA